MITSYHFMCHQNTPCIDLPVCGRFAFQICETLVQVNFLTLRTSHDVHYTLLAWLSVNKTSEKPLYQSMNRSWNAYITSIWTFKGLQARPQSVLCSEVLLYMNFQGTAGWTMCIKYKNQSWTSRKYVVACRYIIFNGFSSHRLNCGNETMPIRLSSESSCL